MNESTVQNDPFAKHSFSVARPLRIATRGSMLALWQAEYVSALFTKRGVPCELVIIKTTGDTVQDRFLHEIGGKGLFIRELEDAMRHGKADMAVHSLKDLPVNLPEGFELSAVLPRHRSGDLLIMRRIVAETIGLSQSQQNQTQVGTIDREGFAALGPVVIASSSLRRCSLLEKAAPKIKTVPVRGNVDTRLRKLREGQFDGIILAEASLERLGDRLDTADFVMRSIDKKWFVPCAGQGALAIETLNDSPVVPLLAAFNCDFTLRAVEAERSVLRELGGDCTLPFGCHVYRDTNLHWRGDAVVVGKNEFEVRASASDSAGDPDFDRQIVKILINQLTENGVAEALRSLGLEVPARFVRH